MAQDLLAFGVCFVLVLLCMQSLTLLLLLLMILYCLTTEDLCGEEVPSTLTVRGCDASLGSMAFYNGVQGAPRTAVCSQCLVKG